MLGIILYVAFLNNVRCSYDPILQDLEDARRMTNITMSNIAEEWNIDQYPLFLQSCLMHKSSWEILKRKYSEHILSGLIHGPQIFTVSFMGSGVTAGYDNLQMDVFTNIVESIMFPVLATLSIQFETHNVALASNPSVPYAMCSPTFAGKDVDIIYWEFTYDCGYPECGFIMEQYLRQSLFIPSNPVIALAFSHSPHWTKESCSEVNSSMHIPLDEFEESYLSALRVPNGYLRIVTEMNKVIWEKGGHFHSILAHYKARTGLQFWDHSSIEKYKCKGPFVPMWSQFAAKWHPGIRSHRLRAAQYAYYWLAVFRDAVQEVQSKLKHHLGSQRGHAHIQHVVQKLLEQSLLESQQHITKFPLEKPLIHTNFSDGLQCFTEFEPKALHNHSLSSIVISGLASDEIFEENSFEDWQRTRDSSGWKRFALDTTDVLIAHIPLGLRDYKYVLSGKKESGAISFRISVQAKEGYIFLCEAPGVWRKLSADLVHIWESDIEVHITSIPSTESVSDFHFRRDQASQLQYFYFDHDDCFKKKLCVQTEERVKRGHYVLTLLPQSDKSIALSTILVP